MRRTRNNAYRRGRCAQRGFVGYVGEENPRGWTRAVPNTTTELTVLGLRQPMLFTLTANSIRRVLGREWPCETCRRRERGERRSVTESPGPVRVPASRRDTATIWPQAADRATNRISTSLSARPSPPSPALLAAFLRLGHWTCSILVFLQALFAETPL